MGFKIAEAFVSVKADSTGLREETTRAVNEAGAGQEIKVKLKADTTGAAGGLMANLAPFIIPSIQSVSALSGVLGLVPAAAGAAGLAIGTLKVGMSGFSDALKTGNTPAQLKAANEALADLPPNARASALAVRAIGPAWDSVKLDVQNKLFAGMSTVIKQVAKADLPVLRTGMDAMAGSLNQAAKYTGAWLTSARTTSDVKTIFDNSAIAGSNMARAIQPILGIIRDIGNVGSQFLPGLTNNFALASQKAADFISHVRDTGQLHAWIQTGIDAMKTLWDSFKNIVDIIVKIAQSPPLFGLDFFNILSKVTDLLLKLVTTFPELIPAIEAAVVVWRAWTLGQAALNLVMSANPIGLVIAAIVALIAIGYEVVKHWDVIKQSLLDTWNALKGAASSIWGAIKDFFISIWNTISNFFVEIWNTIRSTATNAWNATGSFLTGALNGFRVFFSGVWNGIVGDFNNIWGRVTGIAQNIWNSVVGAFRSGVNAVINLINGLVNGADTVLGFLHIALIPHVPLMAAGGIVGLAGGGTVGRGFMTNGPRAIVGEGNPNHPEYVIPTDPSHRKNALSLYASLGTRLMAGGGIIDWIGSTVSKVEKWAGSGGVALMNSAVDGLAGGIPAPFHDIATSVGHSAVAAIKALIDKASEVFSAAFHGSPNLAAWIQAALGLTGAPGTWAGPLSVLIGRESGGNPNAINLWDSNAAAGHPSQGLMQTIPSTFQAYHQAGTSWNILDPVANIAAGINYIRSRYGSIFNVQQANPNASPRGYDAGGLLPTGLSLVRNGTGRPERVLNASQTAKLDRMLSASGRGGLGGVTVNVTQVSGSPAETGRFVALALRTVA